MNHITLTEIPRLYTGLAEWAACSIYVLNLKRKFKGPSLAAVMLLACFLQCAMQLAAGTFPKSLWIPGMLLAIGLMLAYLKFTCQVTASSAGYYCVRSFILAEFTASLEWQLYYNAVLNTQITVLWLNILVFFIVFGTVFGSSYYLEKKHIRKENITFKELLFVAATGLTVFFVSNLSYVYANSPFSSQITKEIFNIRTLVDLSGLVILFAYHILRQDMQVKYDLEAMRNILQSQYSQYRKSGESIEMVNRKYHDLKHQIAVLRAEQDSEKRMAFLDEMESEIRTYEAQNKTGNTVVDTILTGKSMTCQRHNIELTSVVDGKLLNFMHVMDICTILGNALDNAIECAIQIEENEKRLIHVEVLSKKEFVVLRFENYYEGSIQYENNQPATTKADKEYHGYGIKSIKYTAKKYNGWVTIDTKDNWFKLNVVIPLPRED
ncbi:GHKL domain-containing protein [Clostridium boliviensis]|uniref:GHKL domain-containing protein n=1 Tax=Clostridium boliviensis TaxID=318465 RepID=A0ABU4GIY9_9CLOT|nr:GHKL domain-containing protein [Clostridium boliviensis]MDW2796918.1 GHKL domain-containing protein [Clostridium boliviensis]